VREMPRLPTKYKGNMNISRLQSVPRYRTHFTSIIWPFRDLFQPGRPASQAVTAVLPTPACPTASTLNSWHSGKSFVLKEVIWLIVRKLWCRKINRILLEKTSDQVTING
jgi:ATP/ADP translocase